MQLTTFIRKAGFSISVELSKLKFGSISITPDIETFYLVTTLSPQSKLIGPLRFHPGSSYASNIQSNVWLCCNL